LFFIKVKLSVKVKLFVLLLCVCTILPGEAVPEMAYTVSGETLNPTHSLTHSLSLKHNVVELMLLFTISINIKHTASPVKD